MTDKRAASDIILDLERRVGQLEGVIGQVDINVKAILNKMNLAGDSIIQPKAPVEFAYAAKPTVELAEATPAVGDVAFSQADTKSRTTIDNSPSPNTEVRNSVVEQRIVYNDGRPVILASVTISDAGITTNVIAKVKTDSHGKWHAQLSGGKYSIEVIKGPIAAKRGFKVEYKIEVLGDGKPLSLERKQIE